jgi:hypothetical protein
MPATSLFFHVGLHKTGTTWLQDALFPTLPHVGLAKTRNLEKVQDHVRKAQKPILVISHEGMSGTISLRKTQNSRLMRTTETAASIRDLSANGIIIGFREHTAWINSAYYEKAKARPVSAPQFMSMFATEELLWCDVLRLFEETETSVFAFFYEELVHRPADFISDLCGFLMTDSPVDVEGLLSQRVNPSPRTARGQFVSRLFLDLSDRLERLPTLRRKVRRWGANVGTLVDTPTHEATPIQFCPSVTEVLCRDWNNLVSLVERRRGRDFGSFRTSR